MIRTTLIAAATIALSACAAVDTAAQPAPADGALAATNVGPGGRMPSGRDLGTRSAVVAPEAAAATAHPLATQTALDVMKRGGNAVDAAIAANAMLGLVEPTGNGIGGDLFAIVWDPTTQMLYGYNGSGRSPMGATLADMQAKADEFMDGEEIPPYGAAPVTVPGTVDGWYALHEKFGRNLMNENLEPAIKYARSGAPIPEVIAFYWGFGPQRFEPAFESGMLEEYENARKTYFDPPPVEGSLFRNPDLADTLERIAYKGRDEFYTGETARRMGDYFERIGGFLRFEDFAAHEGEWIEPICVPYRDTKVCELGPNTQGVAALQMLQMLERFDLREMGFGSPDSIMAQVEAKRLAFADRARGYADPAYSKIEPEDFVQPRYNKFRSTRINLSRAMPGIDTMSGLKIFEEGYEFEFEVGHFQMCEGDTICNLDNLQELIAGRPLPSSTAEGPEDHEKAEDIRVMVRLADQSPEDIEQMRHAYRRLLRKALAERDHSELDPAWLEQAEKILDEGDTTYLTVTDSDGMMVSLIQSNYRGMGSGLVADGLGFMFQDRGQLFSLDPDHPNVFEPGKRPFHTIIPAFAFRVDPDNCDAYYTNFLAIHGRMPGDNELPRNRTECNYTPWLSFGLMGGGMQPQGHVQVILNLVDYDMGLQEAGDAARWEHVGGCEPTDDLTGDECEADMGTVQLEGGIPEATKRELEARGHTVRYVPANGGGYQAIMRDFDSGAWIAATEMRKDGSADGY